MKFNFFYIRCKKKILRLYLSCGSFGARNTHFSRYKYISIARLAKYLETHWIITHYDYAVHYIF